MNRVSRKRRAHGRSSARTNARLLDQAQKAERAGDLGQVAQRLQKYLTREPDNAEILHWLGAIQFQLGQVAAAIECLERAIAINDSNATCLSDLGGIYLAQEQYGRAEQIFRQALVLAPDAPGAQYNLAIALYSQERIAEAIGVLSTLVQTQPDFAEAHFNLGVAYRVIGNKSDAVHALQKAHVLQPDNATIALELARVLRELRLFEQAVTQYLDYLRLADAPDIVVECALTMYACGDSARAIELLSSSMQRNNDHDELALCLSEIQHNNGKLDAAEEILHALVTRNPRCERGIIGLSRLRRITDEDDPILRKIQELLESGTQNSEYSAALYFALGKIYDDLGFYDQAFSNYTRGNKIKHQRAHYSPKKAAQLHADVIATFSEETLRALAAFGNDSDVPLLIIGMPRSGTTLLEQIMSSHREVSGAGELAYFPSLVAQLPKLMSTQSPFPQCVVDMPESLAAKIAENYLALLRRHAADARIVVDKLPGNYLYAGMFKAVFPRGRVINCRREPLDVALSIYFQYFATGLEYAWDLDDIAHCYGLYAELSQHWRTVFSERYIECRYADLVCDFETQIKKILEFCGLQWDPSCADFHRTEREVKTASNWQVRQPLYAHSVNRWQNYEQHIERLIARLPPSMETANT